MIIALGDIHGNRTMLNKLAVMVYPTDTVIQVGDFGWYPGYLAGAFEKRPVPYTLYWIDGNHEKHVLVPHNAPDVVYTGGNTWYVPRGHLREIEGKRILFLGGASSVDRYTNGGWSSLENITPEQEARAKSHEKVDVMVTHSPPVSFNKKHFPTDEYFFNSWGLPHTWVDVNAEVVERVWQHHGCPPLYCGHMHKTIRDGNIRLLDINETTEIR